MTRRRLAQVAALTISNCRGRRVAISSIDSIASSAKAVPGISGDPGLSSPRRARAHPGLQRGKQSRSTPLNG